VLIAGQVHPKREEEIVLERVVEAKKGRYHLWIRSSPRRAQHRVDGIFWCVKHPEILSITCSGRMSSPIVTQRTLHAAPGHFFRCSHLWRLHVGAGSRIIIDSRSEGIHQVSTGASCRVSEVLAIQAPSSRTGTSAERLQSEG
jgi:hypothetical protein